LTELFCKRRHAKKYCDDDDDDDDDDDVDNKYRGLERV